jgi:hypothetical protein
MGLRAERPRAVKVAAVAPVAGVTPLGQRCLRGGDARGLASTLAIESVIWYNYLTFPGGDLR